MLVWSDGKTANKNNRILHILCDVEVENRWENESLHKQREESGGIEQRSGEEAVDSGQQQEKTK